MENQKNGEYRFVQPALYGPNIAISFSVNANGEISELKGMNGNEIKITINL